MCRSTVSLLARFGLLVCVAALMLGALPVTPVFAQGVQRTVNTLADGDDGVCDSTNCTLREAVGYANAGDTVVFSVSGTIDLDSALLVDQSVTISGAGKTVVVNGSGADRVFNILSGIVMIDHLAITGGNMVGDGGGIFVDTAAEVTLTNVTLTGNWAQNGGAVANLGILNLVNTTIADNTAATNGGGLYTSTAVFADNSIIGNNTVEAGEGPDCYTDTSATGVLNLGAYNVIGDITGCAYTETVSDNVVGANPGLDALQTSYYPLLSSSPALNFIPGPDCNGAPADDQRGAARPTSKAAVLPADKCDSGAVEMSYATAVSPAMEAVNAARSTTVKITASRPLSAASANKNTFSVNAGFTGLVQSGYSGTSGSITLAPTANFLPGELVQVTATKALKDSASLPGLSSPVTWSFRAAAKAGPGLNLAYSMTGGTSIDIAMAQINPTVDSYLDVAVAQAGNISVKRNNFYGDFSWANTITVASGDVVGVNFGDFNGDGKADMLVTAASQELLYLNNSDGNFATVVPVVFNAGASGVKDAGIADVDSDGDLDVVLVGTGTNKVFANDGLGAFTELSSFTAFSGTTSVAMADLERDGDVDAVVSTTAASGSNKIFLNNGKGSFTAGPTFGVAGKAAAAADLNNDGYPDVVTSGNGGTHAGVWLNDQTGKFPSETALSSGTEATGLGLADLDGDGDLDLVITNTFKTNASNLETVWYNNGSGVFAPPVTNPSFDANMETMAVAMGDVNNDGRVDAVFANTKTTAGGQDSNNAETTFLNDTRPVVAPFTKNGVEESNMTFAWSEFLAAYTDADLDPMLKVRIDTLPPASAGVLYQGLNPVYAGQDLTEAQMLSVVFKPAANFSGTATLNFSATDGGFFSLPAVLTIAYAGQDDAPVWTGTPANVTAPEMAPMSIDLAPFVSDIDTLPENLTFTFTSVPPSAGMAVNPVTKKFEWTPTEAEGAGTYNVTFKVADATTTVTAPAAVTITVSEVNLPPQFTLVADASFDELTTKTFQVVATDPDNTNQTVTYSTTGTLPDGATFNPATRTFSWTPTEAQGPMTATITFVATDGQDSSEMPVKLTVNEDNTLPVFDAVGSKTVDEGSPLSITVLAHDDVDKPVQTLTYSMTSKPAGSTFDAATRTFTWTPGEAQGPDVVTVVFKVSDGYGFTELPVQITVSEVNAAPVFKAIAAQEINEETALSFKVEATDADLPVQALTIAKVALPAGATFDAATQMFSWTPTEAQGPDYYTATFSVTDGEIAAPVEMTVNIHVAEVNKDPVISNGDKKVATGRLLEFTVAATDGDVPAQTVTVGIEAATLPTGATYTNGTFSWTPTTAQVGDHVVTLWADDTMKKVTKDITITVVENKAPAITTGDQTVDENVELVLPIATTDGDGDAVTVTTVTANLPAGAVFANGTLTWTPSEAQGGADHKITFTADDGVDQTSKEITFHVNKTNSAPYFTKDSYDKKVFPGQPATIVLEAKDDDLPANTVVVALKAGTELPAFITYDAAKTTFTVTPKRTDVGVYTVVVTVTDGVIAQPLEKTITITVGYNGLFMPMLSK